MACAPITGAPLLGCCGDTPATQRIGIFAMKLFYPLVNNLLPNPDNVVNEINSMAESMRTIVDQIPLRDHDNGFYWLWRFTERDLTVPSAQLLPAPAEVASLTANYRASNCEVELAWFIFNRLEVDISFQRRSINFGVSTPLCDVRRNGRIQQSVSGGIHTVLAEYVNTQCITTALDIVALDCPALTQSTGSSLATLIAVHNNQERFFIRSERFLCLSPVGGADCPRDELFSGFDLGCCNFAP